MVETHALSPKNFYPQNQREVAKFSSLLTFNSVYDPCRFFCGVEPFIHGHKVAHDKLCDDIPGLATITGEIVFRCVCSFAQPLYHHVNGVAGYSFADLGLQVKRDVVPIAGS